jgi:hypothetical protein
MGKINAKRGKLKAKWVRERQIFAYSGKGKNINFEGGGWCFGPM